MVEFSFLTLKTRHFIFLLFVAINTNFGAQVILKLKHENFAKGEGKLEFLFFGDVDKSSKD